MKNNTKTLAKDEQGDLMRTREHLVEEIDGAWANLYSSMEQIRRRHYFKLGELFIQLRMTFPKGHNGERPFARFCRERFPAITRNHEQEYMICIVKRWRQDRSSAEDRSSRHSDG
jgi:hypothetical protein